MDTFLALSSMVTNVVYPPVNEPTVALLVELPNDLTSSLSDSMAATLNGLLVLPFSIKMAARYSDLTRNNDSHKNTGHLAALNTNAFDIVVDNTAFRGLFPRNLLRVTDVCIAGVTDLSSLDSIANDAAKLGIRTWMVKDATEVVSASTLSASSYQVTDSAEISNMLKAKPRGIINMLTDHAVDNQSERIPRSQHHLQTDSDVSMHFSNSMVSDRNVNPDPRIKSSSPTHGRRWHDRYTFMSTPRSPIEMCTVCGVRPRYQKGSKSYPTCGLICNAKLEQRSAQVEMCDVCQKKPRHADSTGIYPQCGRTCRDKARFRNSLTSSKKKIPEPEIFDTSCLMCWRTSKQGNSDFCEACCALATERNTSLLLEAPRGHVTFKDVAEHFKETWKALVPCPEVRSIFKIQQSRAFLAGLETYQIAKNEQLRKSASDTASNRRWHGITRECNLGDSDMQDLCFSPKCLLCSVIQTSFRDAKAGIYTSTASSSSHQYSKNVKNSSQVMLLMEVVVGKEILLMKEEDIPHSPPSDFDSVRVRRSEMDDDVLIVYQNHAIKSLYLVVYASNQGLAQDVSDVNIYWRYANTKLELGPRMQLSFIS